MHFNSSSQFDLSSLSGRNIVLNGSQDLLPSGAQVPMINILSVVKESCLVSIKLACWSFDLVWVQWSGSYTLYQNAAVSEERGIKGCDSVFRYGNT